MPFIIGTDEAGYGPNLGPLVIGGTLWQVPDSQIDLYDALADVIARPEDIDRDDDRIPVGDSKSLYQRSAGIRNLERSALTLISATHEPPEHLLDLFAQIANTTQPQLAAQHTYCWDQVDVPLACNPDDFLENADKIRAQFSREPTCCHSIAAEVVFPDDFNRGLEDCGNKASLLTSKTCSVIRQLLDSLPEDQDKSITVLCDKHGGRGCYAGILQEEMTDSFIRVMHESREESCYRWTDDQGDFEMRFIARGERYLPIALASVVAKYLRELSMEAWNRFWQEHLPELVPTAGYPQDARRFKQDIGGLQAKLQVEDRVIWRAK
ncbi:MAG: hypothetical protein ACR2NP_09850 [Pirellulaceae bacterium]